MSSAMGQKQIKLPDDWRLAPLSEHIWFQEGPGLRDWQFQSSGLKVINVTNLQTNGYLDLSRTDRHISWEEFDRIYKHFLVEDGDVVMASSGNSYCKTAVVRKVDLPLLMNTSVIRFKAKPHLDRLFMLVFLKSKYFKAQIDLMITGGAQPNFGPFHLKKISIPLPPTIKEQQAIAEALSDADALIESLEQLIAKKRLVKQGAMQELLIGKRRVEGFASSIKYRETEVGLMPEDWKLRAVDRIAAITTGGRNTQDRIEDGEFPFFVRSQTIERINSFSFDGEAVLTAGDGVGTGKVFHYINGKFDAHQRVYQIHNFAKTVNGYFFFLYFSNHFYGRIMQMTAKSSVDSVRREMIANMLIPVPSSLQEQEAIVSTLRSMEDEIEMLLAKLAKLRTVKLGMMQELLTGRIRLI